MKNNFKFLSLFLFKVINRKSILALLIIVIELMFSNQNKTFVLAQTGSKTPVDVELVLSVDVSGSISGSEFNLQHQGYINAFKDPGVISTIENLPNGLAVTLQYWSDSAHSSIGWYHIRNAADAQNFANAIAAASRPSAGSTNVTDAITQATNLLLNNNYDGQSLVIDVSGDGLDNKNGCDNGSYNATVTSGSKTIRGIARKPIEQVICSPVQNARNAALAKNIKINGLAILSPNKVVDSGMKVGNDNLPFIIGRDYFAFNREDEIDGVGECVMFLMEVSTKNQQLNILIS
jgi:hypothetical protein